MSYTNVWALMHSAWVVIVYVLLPLKADASKVHLQSNPSPT